MPSLRRWKNKRVGLALGSGGARGWAHLGVLRALRERGVRVDCVAGTSMGAIVGAFLAAGQEGVLADLASNIDWKRLRQFFWEISLSRSGLTDGRRLAEETERLLGREEFRELELPFRAVATDLDTGEEVVLSEGNLVHALRASISIPGLFSPVRLGGRLLVDGGLVNPVPVNVARGMGAQIVVAVDVARDVAPEERRAPPPVREPERVGPLRLPKETGGEETVGALRVLETFFEEVERKVKRLRAAREAEESKPDMVEVLVRSVRIAEAQISLARRRIEPPDVLVEPKVGHVGTLDFQRAPEAMAAGYEAAVRALEA